MDTKPSLKEWLTEKEITFVIVTVLVIYVLERLAKGVHQDVFVPFFHKCLTRAGCEMYEERPWWQKAIIHLLEFSIAIVILYFVSCYLFGHGRKQKDIKEKEKQVDDKDKTNGDNSNRNNIDSLCDKCDKNNVNKNSKSTSDKCDKNKDENNMVYIVYNPNGYKFNNTSDNVRRTRYMMKR